MQHTQIPPVNADVPRGIGGKNATFHAAGRAAEGTGAGGRREESQSSELTGVDPAAPSNQSSTDNQPTLANFGISAAKRYAASENARR